MVRSFYRAVRRIMRKCLCDAISIEGYRNRVNKLVYEHYDGRVAFGIHNGLKLRSESVWGGGNDLASKILGTYEQSIQNTLVQYSGKGYTLIDVGAADGFYAVGGVFSGAFEEVICFEITSEGRHATPETARLNAVEDKIKILGEATKTNLVEQINSRGQCLVLVDIEGAEFALFDSELLAVGSTKADWIIEIHENRAPNGKTSLSELIAMAENWYSTKVIYQAPIDPARYKILHDFNDNMRLLAFSEGRSQAPKWLYLRRKSQ